MSKRLCKMNHRDIRAGLGQIHQLVAQPKFVCSSCARSANDKSSLCKPCLIPEQARKPIVDMVSLAPKSQVSVEKNVTKKALKQVKKRDKKLKKMLKAQRKLLKKHRKLEAKLAKVDKRLNRYAPQLDQANLAMH
ncbi:hypothetical protein SAMN04488136_11918 [Vibrio xiamenensis]|uniref:Uncharacterized protein n=1 Tax=Vibrio xiamenensis TaxID=861298 RepID=A0A1G8DAF4_9VIBR|nr:hypothetical protein [Vibrio xiamenensis]SDH54544.1 hypothetical protein SAMN04488136_11918 [Vibrio xiamenensis]